MKEYTAEIAIDERKNQKGYNTNYLDTNENGTHKHLKPHGMHQESSKRKAYR